MNESALSTPALLNRLRRADTKTVSVSIIHYRYTGQISHIMSILVVMIVNINIPLFLIPYEQYCHQHHV